MNINKQVCTLDQAGVIGSVFPDLPSIWGYYVKDGEPGFKILPRGAPIDSLYGKHVFLYPAYTVAELGEILHSNGFSVEYVDTRKYAPGDTYWFDLVNTFELLNGEEIYESYSCATEAQARASALIWLIEHKYLKAGDIAL